MEKIIRTLADKIGVYVDESYLLMTYKGQYFKETWSIRVSAWLDTEELFSTELHELGHAYHCRLFGNDNACGRLTEMVADKFCLIWLAKLGKKPTEERERHYMLQLAFAEDEEIDAVDPIIKSIFEFLGEDIPEDF